jgi:outer membrane protein assembly factor BamC
MNFKYTSLAALLSIALSGCGALPALDEVVPDNTKEYRKAETMPPLDVPPDLSTSRINDEIAKSQSGSATYSEFEEEANNPLVSKYNITPDIKPALAGEGDKRRLVVPTSLDAAWQQLESFVDQKGLGIKRADKRIGLMDTNTGPDDYAYRLRIERGDTSKQSLVYVSAAGVDDNAQKNEAMLRQVADFFGVVHQQQQQAIAERQASSPQAATIKTTLIDEQDGNQALHVEQDFPDVWRRVGRVLDSKGFSVEDRDRSRGIYFVHYIDPFNNAEKEEEGILSSLAFWRDDAEKTPDEFYNIKLISDAENTKIIILDAEETRSSSDTAKRLLKLIQEQLGQ